MEKTLTIDQQQKLDSVLNKTFLDLVVYSVGGYAIGLGASILFKNKAPIRNVLAGIGGSYGFAINKANFNHVV